MRLIRNRPESRAGAFVPEPTVVAIGNFDAVHRGHQALVARCRELAGEMDRVVVLTFEPLPPSFFSTDGGPARLTTVYSKLRLLCELGVDVTWMVRFDRRFASLTAREFCTTVLAGKLRARTVVVGQDFRFGAGAEGDVPQLQELGAELGFRVAVVPAVTEDGERISSSGVRAFLAEGNIEAANRWLGRPFRMEGHVIRGAGLGRKLGYPTANLRIRAEPSPLKGVLATFARIGNGPWLPSVANLGRRPAVGGKDHLLEVHFFDFDEDIYGQRLDVQFVAKLRDELNFDNLDALVEKMRLDEEQARSILAVARRPADEKVTA
jgi:riboflavin kinase/FMN adenylyltransferase